MNPCAVVFDAFGTLVKCEQHHQPYLQMMQWMRQADLAIQPETLNSIMSQPGSLEETMARFNISPPINLLSRWNSELQESLQDIRLYPDALPTIERLRQLGYCIGLCANMTEPYRLPVVNQLPRLDAYAFGYNIGALKPQPKIYESLLDQLACHANTVLFIGDSPGKDVVGPKEFGMNARYLARWKGWGLDHVLRDLLAGHGMEW